MFMLDRWDELRETESMDPDTVTAAQALVDEMCSVIFDRMGLTIVREEKSLVVVGRGLRYVFPLRGDNISLKYENHNRSDLRLSKKKKPFSRGDVNMLIRFTHSTISIGDNTCG